MNQFVEKVRASIPQALLDELTMAYKAKECLIVVEQLAVDVLFADLQTVDNQSADGCRLRVTIKDEELEET